MDYINYSKGVITFWKGDYKVLRYEANLLGDVFRIPGELMFDSQDFDFYDKVTLSFLGEEIESLSRS